MRGRNGLVGPILPHALLAPGLLAALLALVVGAELVPQGQPGQPAAPVAGAAEPAVAAPVQDRAAALAALLDRPLFDPLRRPPAEPAMVTATLAVHPHAVAPRLAGVMIGPGMRQAIFATPAGGRMLAVAEGASVDGFLVQAITPAAVLLAGPDGPVVVHASRDPEASGEAAAGPPVLARPGPAFTPVAGGGLAGLALSNRQGPPMRAAPARPMP